MAAAWAGRRKGPEAGLRSVRGGLARALGVGGLSGVLSLEDVVKALTVPADGSLDAAVRTAIA